MNTYTFSDVLIKPQYSEITSRKNIDTSIKLTNTLTLKLPIISANMKTITGPKMAAEIYVNGGFGILHRFNDTTTAINDFEEAYTLTLDAFIHEAVERPDIDKICGVSIGVQESDESRFDMLYTAGARIFCIDVAHGHHILVKNMLSRIKEKNLTDIVVIAGNIATPEAAYDLTEWGADIIKIGIGPSPVCTTRTRTGVGIPQLSALEEISNQIKNQLKKVKIIADGGISNTGDIAKALKFADLVMIGSLFAGTSETPGKAFRGEMGEWYKVYGGSASGENKVSNGQDNRFVEGMIKTIPFRGHIKYIIREIEDGLRSAMSYSNAKNLQEFKEKCEFIFLSSGGKKESKL